MEPKIIKPQIGPRDIIDGRISALVGLVQMLLLFGIPCGITYMVTRNPFVVVAVFVAVYLSFLSFSVFRLEASVSGLYFKRLLGSPKFLRWDEIKEIKEVGRRELVLQGWLWPLFPAREMTPSLSSLHHYRITWGRRHCYYPPENPQEFEELVREHVDPLA